MSFYGNCFSALVTRLITLMPVRVMVNGVVFSRSAVMGPVVYHHTRFDGYVDVPLASLSLTSLPRAF